MLRTLATSALVAALMASALAAAPTDGQRTTTDEVVIAIVDSGIVPTHPVFRRQARTEHPSSYLVGYPSDAPAAQFAFSEDRQADFDRSEAAFAIVADGFAWVPGTNIVGTMTFENDPTPLVDRTTPSIDHEHGNFMASAAAGGGLTADGHPWSFAPEALLVMIDIDNGPQVEGVLNPVEFTSVIWRRAAEGIRWAAEQPWIDVITLARGMPPANNPIVFQDFLHAIEEAVAAGKLVINAAGNFAADPSFAQPVQGVPGTLNVGANDNCGPVVGSSGFPHVVADGTAVIMADADSYGEDRSSGTSFSSPRVAGYAAEALRRVRAAVGHRTRQGALVNAAPELVPTAGPLSDGVLAADELHDAIRVTANPFSHESALDGDQTGTALDFRCYPGNTAIEGTEAGYAKMGYGEVSEHTIDALVDLLMGRLDRPDRQEDRWYEHSEQVRQQGR